MTKPNALLLPLLLLISACASNIHVDYETQQSFADYQTYQIQAHTAEPAETYDAFGGDIFEARLHRVITNAMAIKGLSEAKTPDFFVDYALKTEQHARIRNDYPFSSWRNHLYWNNSYYRHRFDSHVTDIREFTVGTLTLKIIDAQSNKTVWTSSTKTRLRNKSTPEEAEAALQERVHEMLARFPPNNVITL